MSIKSTSMSLSKEMSVEESYSKTTSSVISSSTMESSMESSSMISSSSIGDSSALMSSLTKDLDSQLALTSDKALSKGMKMSSLEKSSSLLESEDAFSMSKSEISSSIDVQESSKKMSMMASKEEVSMSKSESSSETVSKSLVKSESISQEISEEKKPVYVVVMDYSPRAGDSEGLAVSEGQEVELIDSSRAHKWRVRLRQEGGAEGMVPSCYLEKKTTVSPSSSPQLDPKAQAAKTRREKVLQELVESEEAFARDMQYVVNNYIHELESKSTPKELRDQKDALFSRFDAISEFHNKVLLKGIQYYVDDPPRLGKTFLRLERDFDQHVTYCRDEPEAQQLLQGGPLKVHFDEFSRKIQDEKTLSEHLKLPIQRINDYQLIIKELIKYGARLKEDTKDLERALEFMQAIPQRITDLQYINSIQGYKGNLHKLGRILKHDWFEVTEPSGIRRERFAFLFKGRIFITDQKRVGAFRSIYLVKHAIKLPEVEIVDNADDDDLKIRFQSLKPGASGYPISLKSKSEEQKEDWLKEIQHSSRLPVEDLDDDEEYPEVEPAKVEEIYEKQKTTVEVLEDFEAYEEMHTVVTESVRSGSLTSLEDFHSALEDEPSLCFTTSDVESGGPGRPRFVQPLKAQAVSEGLEVVLECEICASPEAIVAWLKDNEPYVPPEKNKLVAEDGGHHRLLIKKAECADAGLYTIIASNLHGTTSCCAPLTVSSAPSSIPPTLPDGSVLHYGPLFREKLRDTTLQEGTDFRMSVQVEGEPKPKVKFFKNDEVIGTVGRVRYNEEEPQCYELVIDNVMKEDAGRYTCVTESSVGRNVTTCDITVTGSKLFVKIDDTGTSTPEVLDDQRQLSPDQGSKEAVVETEESENFKVSIDEKEDTLSLVFQHVTPGDPGGMYTCVASTGSGKITCSAELTVQGGVPRDPERPKVSAPVSKVEAKEGGSALLELSATGFPKPVITWSKDGEELKTGDGKYAVLQEDDETYTFAIKDVKPEDSGKYTAEAINDMGKDQTTYDVTVTSPPKFIKGMKDSSVLIDDDIEFAVEIDGCPEPTISWCKDGQPLKETFRIKITSDNGIRNLKIGKAKIEDAGTYSCILKNNHGSQGSFGALQVNAPATITKGLCDVLLASGSDASFSVTVAGNPTPQVKWYKDDTELKADGSHIIIREENETTHTLMIKKATNNDVGTYSCEVSNVHGEDNSEGKLKLIDEGPKKQTPHFEGSLSNVKVTEGEDLLLKVKVSGQPEPIVKWSKDGKDVLIDDEHTELKKEKDGSLTLVVHNCASDDAGEYTCTISNSEGSESTSSKVTVTEKTEKAAFKKGLKDVEVVEGEDIIYDLKITGVPTPKDKWSKDGSDLEIDGEHVELTKSEADGSLKLTVHKCTKEDAGKYTCTISNSEGSESTSSKVTITEKTEKAAFKKGLKDVEVVEGEDIIYDLKITGVPTPKDKWSKDGSDLEIDGEHVELTKSEADGSLKLIVHKCTKEDAGKYTCTISNAEGSESTSSKVTITETTEKASFKKGLKDVKVTEGEDIVYNLKITGKPKPTAKWTKDGATLTIDGKHIEQKREDADDSLTLIIHNCKKEDAGEYSCTIENKEGSETTTSKVTVTEITEKASFKKSLKDVEVTEGEDIAFDLKISGTPKPDIKWTKDGTDLKIDGEHVELRKEDADDSLTLIVHKCTEEDAGNYKCSITNAEGSDSTSSKVKVTAATESPKFLKGLDDVSAKTGETVEFKVKVTGKPSVKWTKDDVELKLESTKWEYRTEEDGDSLTLILKKAENEDEGEYACIISNEKGSATSKGKLSVTESGKAPSFRKKLSSLSVIEEETVELEVQFDGEPKPTVEWSKDDSKLAIDEDHYEISTTKDSETLTVNEVTKEDAGKYSCKLSNSSGSITCSADVTVKESTSAPKILKGLKDQTVREEQMVKMTVKYAGKPKPTHKWTKDDAELTIDDSSRYKIEEAEASFTLVIPQASKEDAGTYACTITNEIGSDKTSAKLAVSESTSAPEFTQKLVDKEVKENGTVEFTVKFTGKPKPAAKWTFDKAELTLETGHTELKTEEDGASLTLIIRGVTGEDVGKYACTITNEHGSQTTSARLTVSVPPRFVKGLEDKEAEEGVPLRLNVKFEGQPEPTAAWKKDGIALDLAGGHFKTSIESDDSMTLIIDKLGKEDAGKFTCDISNSQGSASTSALVTVTGKPIIKKGLEDRDIVEGESNVELIVEASGTPAPEIKWFLCGKEVNEDDNFGLAKDDGKGIYHLRLKKAAGKESTGEIRFEAENTGGKAETKANLRLLTKPVFTKVLSDASIVEGDELTLDTTVEGIPTPEITWLFGKKQLKSDDHYNIAINGQSHKLTITDSRVEDSGCYSCKAVNKAGDASQKATVTVKSKKDTQAPQFLTPLQDMVVVVGDAVRFETRVTGKPSPQVTWYRGSEELSESDGVLIRSNTEDYSHSLTLKDLKIKDSSEYLCKAVNEYGEAKEKAQLAVKEPVAPQVEDLQDQIVRYGAPARLKAKISGFPTPNIQWLKDGQPISGGSERYEVVSEHEKRHFSLNIKSVTKDEVGRYTCTATNDAGQASAECIVSIKAQAPVFARDPKDKNVELGEEFIFEAEIYGFPPPDVTWLKDNKPFQGATASNDGDIYKLSGRIQSMDDAGVIKCKAQNEAGEDSRNAQLAIADFPPNFVQKLPSNLNLTEGDKLSLKAKLCGKPEPEIKWLKDGKALRPSNKISTTISPDGTVELVIPEVTHSDAGIYRLVATNPKGHVDGETGVAVGFIEKQTKPFVGQLHPVDVEVGTPVILEAKVMGNPTPEIKWTKNGNSIMDDSHIKLSREGEKAILKIDSSRADDTGEYKLTVTNSQGQDESSASVTVSVPGKKPAFLKELKAVKVNEGEEARLEVIVSGYPMPTIAWFRNGKNIMEGKHCVVTAEDTGLASLKINDVACEDGGMYTVTATNKLGKAVSEAPLLVSPAVKTGDITRKAINVLEFLKALMPQLVPEGQSCTLEAQTTTEPKPVDARWTKDGKEIPPSERLSIQNDLATGTFQLTLPQMAQQDRGKYVIHVSDGNIEIKSEALVNVVPAMPGLSGNKPFFLNGLEPQKVGEGETIQLRAQLAPNSGSTIKWMKDGDDVTPSDRVQILEQPNGQIALIIEAASLTDAGKYVVIASNETGKSRSTAMVAVVGTGFRLPEIKEALQPASFEQGQPGKLTAKVDAEPKPEIQWLKDGSPVLPNERIKTKQEPDGTVSLEISNVLPEDEGKYTLLVSNLGGETRTSAPVEVIKSPLFLKALESTSGVIDCPAKLECKVSGDPVPDITWTKDGNEIPEDGNTLPRQLPNGELSLSFLNCRPEDEGMYTCTARNKHGEKSTTANLKVIAREAKDEPHCAPSFIKPLQDMKTEEGKPLVLEAILAGNPLPQIQWFMDHQPLSTSSTIYPAFDGKKATLSISDCQPSRHEGVYECKASNVVGEVCSRALVSVIGKEAPKFIEGLSDMQFSTNKPMTLRCRVTGVPAPDIEWFYHRSPVYPGIKYQVGREDEKCFLTLPHPREKDSGTYECKAKNVAGKDETSAYVTVSAVNMEGEPPMFLKKPKDLSIPNGMTAKLTACICGSPKPEIKWFKDGQQLSENARIKMETDSNGVVRLIIQQAVKQDIGTYRISIANQFGSETCTATLNVEGDDKIKSSTPKREVPKSTIHGPPSPLAHAPYIFKMSDDSVSLGWRPSIPHGPQHPSTYRLEMCAIPNGQWTTYKSGIKDTSCDIRDLTPGLDYRFRVRVENRYGTSEPSPYVTAHRSQLMQIPTSPTDRKVKDYELEHLKLDKYAAAPCFMRSDEDSTYAVRGHPARIEFWVYGCPHPKITWFFNNEPVDTSKYDFLEDRGGQLVLFITRMREEDVGTYTCKAVNEHGEAQKKMELKIAEMPIFTKRLEPCTSLVRGTAEFRCRVIGTPNPKIRWFKDWQPLAESSRIHIRQEEPDVCILALSDAILRDGGLYTCTASNVAGTATTSAMLTVEECEEQYSFKTYQKPRLVKTSHKPFEDFYDIGDELGRGTQGITYHVVDRRDGRSLAAKVMHGPEHMLDVMKSELDILGELCHPRLLRLQDAHETKSSLTLTTDLCGGGELLPSILQRDVLTESIVAHYIKQVLEGLKYMHQKNIAHLGLTIGDVLLTRLNGDNIKIGDFGLATRLYQGREFIQEYGHPEFVAPEIANKQPVTLAADLWSVGIISYILLVGDSPFLRENDRETLKAVQEGKADFFHGGFAVLSDEARDFVTKLLQPDPSQRLNIDTALNHKWLQLDELPDKCDELENNERLREYYRKWKSWYSNAQCRWFYRRRTLESCFTHPSRMIYPPDEEYTPPLTPDRELERRSRIKPAAFDDLTFRQKIEREVIDPRSESHYQNGPDTFLLPLRDPDFPVRIRRYLKVGANRSPLLARHLKDKHWGYQDVAVRERRKFVDVMDEEISDEKRGVSGASPQLRFRHEVGTPGSEYEHWEREQAIIKRRRPGTEAGWAPFFREKIRHVAVRENEDAVFRCRVTAHPSAQVSWFRNDGILVESSRILISQYSDGRCSLTLRPAKAYDVGVYKCVARNSHGVTTCRARLHLGTIPNKPEPPHADRCSDTDVLLRWAMPKDDAFVIPTLGYSLEYKQEGTEEWTKLNGVIPTHEFYLFRGLSPATAYRFRIRSRNKFGWSELSSPSEPVLTLAEPSPKIELSRTEQFHQEQAESGLDPALSEGEEEDQQLDYLKEEEPVQPEKTDPTEVCNYISEIAKGRFSLVMKVWHKVKNTACVAKAISLQKDPEAAWRELQAHSSLVHERIPLLYSALESKDMLFLIMEKLDAVDVLKALSSRPLYSEEAVSRIILQVLDALEYLHYRSFCYLELQPDNVLLMRPYFTKVKLVDFGSVREEGSIPPREQSPSSCIEYLAPEILKGGECIHTPADIWSVGVLTYILLSGVSPFAGESLQETRDNIQWVRYHFDHLHREASPESTHFLMQLFKRTPEKRPTASECQENKWLLPAESLIRKRERTMFPSHALREFSEKFHSQKASHTPQHLLNMFGKKDESV